ncbi:VOC family protein [Streptomyces sp. NPDC087212]|uniref:VOC family protein n=1 Tax=Streptomyces sp. NPDC087212 TaxID=3365766 RepID=UPI00382B523B
MNVSLMSLVVAAADLESESSFWHQLLGGSVMRAETHHFLQAEGFPVIVVQHVPDHVPPQWPDGAPLHLHFDLATDDVAAADELILHGGGRRLRPTDDVSTQQGARVYASAAGHPFCVRSA